LAKIETKSKTKQKQKTKQKKSRDLHKDCVGAIRAFFGIDMSKNENPSKQNDILVVVKETLIYFTF
jgi:hypothetical protein